MIQVLTYSKPDLDGFSCAYAYSEFLRVKKLEAEPVIVGKPRREVDFVLNKFNIDTPASEYDLESDVILVDASDVRGILDKINLEKVIEVIDHREVHEGARFKNAKLQIELVGAAATLIAEKFIAEKLEPSRESAVLLYSAIVSNTTNFKNNVTTDRDIDAAEWLLAFIDLDPDYIREMFKYASDIDLDSWEMRFAFFEFNEKKVGIAQLEIVGVMDFVKDNFFLLREKLEVGDKEFDYCFLTCVDVDKGYNLFVSIDDKTQELLVNVLKIKFEDNLARREGILMRKEIAPLLKNYLLESKK